MALLVGFYCPAIHFPNAVKHFLSINMEDCSPPAITEEKIASNDLSRSLAPSHPNISNLTDIAGHKCQMKDRLYVNPFLTSWIIIPDVLTKN